MGNRYEPGKPSFWTPKRTETLADLCSQGLTFRQIAKEIGHGCTRNMALAKAHRMELSNAGVSNRPSPVPPPEPPPAPVPTLLPPNPDFPTRCHRPGCRNTKQANPRGFCAEHESEYLSGRNRVRDNMHEVSVGVQGARV